MEIDFIKEMKKEKIQLKQVAEKLNMQRSVVSNVLNEDLIKKVEGAVLQILKEKRGQTDKIISIIEEGNGWKPKKKN